MNILVDELKPKVTEVSDFESRYQSKISALFGFFGLSEYRCKDQKEWFSFWYSFWELESEIFDWTNIQDIKSVIRDRKEFRYQHGSILVAVFGTFGLSKFRRRGKIDGDLKGYTSRKFLTDFLMEEKVPLLRRNMTLKIERSLVFCNSCNPRTIRNLMPKSKRKLFPTSPLLLVYSFRLWYCWKESSLSLRRNMI